MTLRTVLLSLQALLATPEPDDPQDAGKRMSPAPGRCRHALPFQLSPTNTRKTESYSRKQRATGRMSMPMVRESHSIVHTVIEMISLAGPTPEPECNAAITSLMEMGFSEVRHSSLGTHRMISAFVRRKKLVQLCRLYTGTPVMLWKVYAKVKRVSSDFFFYVR